MKGSLPYPTLSIGVFTAHLPGMDEEGGVGWKTRNLNGVDNSGRGRRATETMKISSEKIDQVGIDPGCHFTTNGLSGALLTDTAPVSDF